jgi:SOS response regulatory protein OraA/RecX
MNILLKPEDEQSTKFSIELSKYANYQETINTALKVLESREHRPAQLNQKVVAEDEQFFWRGIVDSSTTEVYHHPEDDIYSELIEK